ncbi:uncharacterized protein LOC123021072 [Varanus komodoensis]|uniref:uncharacterized protein LOC123021072 n=1 Tax=Varanus komodoensis TaxID=61221 RepID=UPI001CF79F16|nr:uncharacterized protein LOC123021072 [Varanus komodoensis]XP_044281413.1 uncharacterized protein LOC123021072 [Varanus komodoensis]XP_044281414.1 uncharacterized protein LOC123021072 [Varanus komodoensis]
MTQYSSKELIFANLLVAMNKEEKDSKMYHCLSCALEMLQKEPPCVRSNARLSISDGHTLKEFTSGDGECTITIFHNQGKIQYDVFVPTWEMYLSRLCSGSQPLSLGNILSIRSHLHSWGSSRPGFSSLACFDRAAERFSMEPEIIKRDAEMLVECAGKVVKFVSGQGNCKISVFFRQGEPEYLLQINNLDVAMERLRTGTEPLNLENLWKVRDMLDAPEWRLIRDCLDVAIDRFWQEPQCVQNNAKMLVFSGNKNILLISGKGENLITVTCKYGKIVYKLSERGWWEVAARVLQKKEATNHL